MGRPPLWRGVTFIPPVTYFKPAGVPLATLEKVQLSLEEVEAIRLKSLEGLEQENSAQKTNISRTTFARILTPARKAMPLAPEMRREQEIDFLTRQAQAMGEQLEASQTRINELSTERN